MLSRTLQHSIRATPSRSFSVSRTALNNFKEKEAGEELLYVKKQEAEQLKALKEKLAKQKAQLDELNEKLKAVAGEKSSN